MGHLFKTAAVILLSTLLFFFIVPDKALASNLYIKMSLGFNVGGLIQDTLSIPSEYSPYVTIANNPKHKFGMDASLELLYHFTPQIGLIFGYGYLSGGKKGGEAEITAADLDRPFTGQPRLDWEANSIYVTAIYAVPLSQTLVLNLGAGAAYYMARFKHRTAWITGLGSSGSVPNDSFNWDHESQNWGFHAQASLDFALFENMFFAVDVLYRRAEFEAHVIELYAGQGSTIRILEWIEYKDIPYVDYEVTKVGLSGFALRGGIKFRF